MVQTVFVDTHDGLSAVVDVSLRTCGSLFNLQLRQTGLDSFGHAAKLLNLLDVIPCATGYLVGQSLYIVGTAPRVNLLRNVGFLLDVYLGVTCNTCREVGRQCYSLVKSVGVQRLGMA